MQNPENYNDWAESSEVGMFANGIAYLGESLHYRVDLNAHDNFPSTTERRQSLLNFVKMLSYSPKRNICATGIAKLTSISTTQSVTDTAGNLLKDTTISWNDSSNPDWLEQFLTVMNSAFVSNNPFGKPLKKEVVDSITTQLYELNNTTNNNTVYSFTTSVNATTQQFEVVNADIDTTLNVIYERTPIPEQAFHILYRNDGTGNSSKNTGFFVYWKQGSLQSEYNNFSQKIENNYFTINTNNINEYDVWVQEIDSSSGLVKENWTKIANDEYLVYNNTDSQIRNIYKVETRENDTVIVRFSDGKFGTIPVGLFRFWYRVSQGNSNLYIKPADMKNISIRIPYKSNNTTDDNIYYLTLTFSVEDISHIRQAVPQESMEYIRTRSPQVYSTQNRMVTGQDGNLYNGITTIDLSNNLVVFNLQELLFNSSRRLINTQMINLLTYLSNEIVDNKKKNDNKNKKQNMLIVVDEFHYFIDEDNPTLLKYFGQMARRLRKYNAGIVVATQQPSDLTSSAGVLRHASSLFGNCQYQITGMLKDNDVQAIEKIYANTPLTETQKSFLSKCGQGQFLVNITNKNRLRINVFATPLQLYYMGETDEFPNGEK